VRLSVCRNVVSTLRLSRSAFFVTIACHTRQCHVPYMNTYAVFAFNDYDRPAAMLAARRPLCFATDVSIFFFIYPPNLPRSNPPPIVSRHQTLPHVKTGDPVLLNWVRNLGPLARSPWTLAVQNIKILGDISRRSRISPERNKISSNGKPSVTPVHVYLIWRTLV